MMYVSDKVRLEDRDIAVRNNIKDLSKKFKFVVQIFKIISTLIVTENTHIENHASQNQITGF